MNRDVESILRICGIGTYLQIGGGEDSLVFPLLKKSLDAYGMDSSAPLVAKNLERAPGRFFQSTLQDYPFESNTFDTIIIGTELLQYHYADLSILFDALQQITKRNLVLYFPISVISQLDASQPSASRLFWEGMAIQAGFRRHPRSMLITPYHELENEQISYLTFFERVPNAAREQFSLNWLLANRDLHMDMSREAGRRADAHLSRYVLAATQIRPGDNVLDAACGLGYGTAILSACSPGASFIGVDIDPDAIAYASINFAEVDSAVTYRTCDITNLAFIPDHSIDTVVSFETIEHIENYDVFLAEIKRVLKPDGRIIGSVPNLWCDETGVDPNPYHFHVFDWEKLNTAISKYFIVDGRWQQNAGGGYKLAHLPRSMAFIPLSQTAPEEVEWWIFSACADPMQYIHLPYINPFQKEQDQSIPVHVDFAKYYDNPWLYRVMVQLRERLIDQNVLINFCKKIIQEVRVGSADQGAAICVLAYQFLESGHVTLAAVTDIASKINAFDQAYSRENAHARRWAISLHYVGGRLLLAIGNRDDALKAFLSCAAMDPIQFSPLLATKTLAARMYAGLICAGNDQLQQAQEQFCFAIKQAHQVLQGKWDNVVGSIDKPLPFSLSETAELLDIASQCAQALHTLDRQLTIPGYFWDRINLKRFGLVEWKKSLEQENIWLRQALLNTIRKLRP